MAEAYIRAACSMQSWNPKHFLDVAEFTFGVSVGAHWLNSHLDPGLKAEVRAAISEKSFAAFEKATAKPGGRFWTRGENNWTLVCNSALYVAAVLNPDLERSNAIRQQSYGYLEKGMELYAPDGLWSEGPMYWTYATNFALFAIEAEQWHSGGISPLLDSPGFDRTLETYFDLVGPSGRTFNYADAKSAGVGPIPAVPKLGEYFGQWNQVERYNAMLRDRLISTGKRLKHRFLLFNLLWMPDRTAVADGPDRDRIRLIRGDFDVAVVEFPTENGRDIYLAMKGSYPARSHQHRDAGTFVLDVGGSRFFSDLGKEEYGLKTSDGKKIDKRSVFRVSSRSHNVLMVGGKEQLEERSGSIAVNGGGTTGTATLDLSAVYAGARDVSRTVGVSADGIVMQDEVTGADAEVTWQAYTQAKVTKVKRGAVLTLHGQKLLLDVIEPAGATVTFDHPQPYNAAETKVKGFTRIRITHPVGSNVKFRNRFVPI